MYLNDSSQSVVILHCFSVINDAHTHFIIAIKPEHDTAQ